MANVKRAHVQVLSWLDRHKIPYEPDLVRRLASDLLQNGFVTLPNVGTLRFRRTRRLKRLDAQTRLRSSFVIADVVEEPKPHPSKPGQPKPPMGDPDDPGPRRAIEG